VLVDALGYIPKPCPPRLYIITDGPGSGKTRLVELLAAQGFRHMPEAGRAIIQDQADIGGTALPWDDREAFATLMLSWEMRSYREALVGPGPVIFDRAIPDVIGYLRRLSKAIWRVLRSVRS